MSTIYVSILKMMETAGEERHRIQNSRNNNLQLFCEKNNKTLQTGYTEILNQLYKDQRIEPKQTSLTEATETLMRF